MGLKNKLGEYVGALVIDMQGNFLDDFSETTSKKESQILRFLSKDAKKMIRTQGEIIYRCGVENVPLYLIRTTDGLTKKCKYNPIRPLTDRAVEVKRQYLVTKGYDDSFQGTYLDELLKREDVTTLLLMGINSNACVRDTAKTALKKGYKIATGNNLILDYRKEKHAEAVSWFKENGIWIKNPQVLVR